MMRTKTPNEMSIDEIHDFCKYDFIGCIVCGTGIGAFAFYPNVQTYVTCVRVLIVLLPLFCIASLILLHFRKFILRMFYFNLSIAMNIAIIIFYLSLADDLLLTTKLSKALVFANVLIIPFVLLIKRFVLKNPEFIQALKDKKHVRYILSDVALAWTLCLIVIFIAKQYDAIPLQQILKSPRAVGDTLSSSLFLAVAGAASVYGLCFYFYEARYRTIEEKKKIRH